MISKINRIKKLGMVFSDYTWDTALSPFKQFNLIYGWNGSGKTTLSRLFDAIAGTPPENLEYEITDDQAVKYRQGEVFPKKIRVFNQDYIANNVTIPEGRANSISILLGEENKALVDKIQSDEILLHGDPAIDSDPGKISLHAKYIKDKASKSNERDGKFTEIAKTIGAAIGGNALRDYRKPQAEKDFALIKVKAELSVADLNKYLLSAKQESLLAIDRLILKPIGIENNHEVAVETLLKLTHTESQILLHKTVVSEIISRIAENNDISEWVEQGLHLHSKHSSEICEYCQQKIPVARIEQLTKHFNEADKNLKTEIDILIEKLKKIYSAIKELRIPDRARFYNELQQSYDEKKIAFDSAKQLILQNITELAEELKNKKSKTTDTVDLITEPDFEVFSAHVEGINSIIDIHNTTTSDFDNVKKEAINKVKQHYLSTIYDEVNGFDAEISKLAEDIKLLKAAIIEIQDRIVEHMAQISSKHKACEIINKKLNTFLGHSELSFVPHTEKENEEKEAIVGYRIMRGDKPALYLSEGEKTAIAFVYFIVHLGDENFQVNNGIIVIDDPISSLDSNSLYQAFSFLKNSVKEGSQVFILTHSFEFLKLLINWRRHAGPTGYYMIKNNFPDNIRSAYIDKMDKELCEYESEYHYLFKLLKQLREEQDDTIAKAYPIPNIARKVWDTFLMFSVPNGKDGYKKIINLKERGYDEQKLDAVYKFTNSQSHITGSGFDPSLVPETKKVVKELFEMMEAIAPEHYKIIDSVTN